MHLNSASVLEEKRDAEVYRDRGDTWYTYHNIFFSYMYTKCHTKGLGRQDSGRNSRGGKNKHPRVKNSCIFLGFGNFLWQFCEAPRGGKNREMLFCRSVSSPLKLIMNQGEVHIRDYFGVIFPISAPGPSPTLLLGKNKNLNRKNKMAKIAILV